MDEAKIARQSDLRLYILARNDLASMTIGKTAAQATHAGSDLAYKALMTEHGSELHTDYLDWCRQSIQGSFGATIVLSAPMNDIEAIVPFLQEAGFAAGMVRDDTYPLEDGKFLHLIDINTCGWVFGTKTELKPILQQYGLLGCKTS